jgi:hypothetical protein
MTEQERDEEDERSRLLTLDIEKLLTAHTDSLDPHRASFIILASLARAMAKHALRKRFALYGILDGAFVKTALLAVPWEGTIDVACDDLIAEQRDGSERQEKSP